MGDKKIKVDDLPEFDIAQHLTDEQAIAANLDVVREEGNAIELAKALDAVARTRLARRGQREESTQQ